MVWDFGLVVFGGRCLPLVVVVVFVFACGVLHAQDGWRDGCVVVVCAGSNGTGNRGGGRCRCGGSGDFSVKK